MYVLDLASDHGNLITAYSKQLGRDVTLERAAVSLFLQGREIRPYWIQPSGKVVIIPYRIENGATKLIAENMMREKIPHTFAYMSENKRALEDRERGRMRGPNWYAYIYPKNIDVMRSSKILVPDIADCASFALDEAGKYAFTSGYGIMLKNGVAESLKYILGLLNSKTLDFYLKNVSTPIRGGFFRYFTQFIEQLPIRPINFFDHTDKSHYDRIVSCVDQTLELHKKRAAAKIETEKTLIQKQIDTIDVQINQMVYELYRLNDDEIATVEETTQ